MCLGVPGRIVRWLEREPPLACGEVEFDGTRRVCNLACVPEANEGDFVIVHAGVAITRLDADEAEKLLGELWALCESAEPGEVVVDEFNADEFGADRIGADRIGADRVGADGVAGVTGVADVDDVPGG